MNLSKRKYAPICKKHGIPKYRRPNSTIWVCPQCLIEKNKTKLNTPTKKKATKKRRKKTPRQKAMEKADMYFSRYIRLKYSFEVNGELYCKCYTCGNIHHIKKIQLGHWQRRGYKTTRFHENNGRPQCVKCNYFHSGVPEKFEINLIKEIGIEEVIKLKELSQKIGHDDLIFYTAQAEIFKHKFNELLKERGLVNPWGNSKIYKPSYNVIK